LEGALAMEDHQLSNAALFELLDAWAPNVWLALA
jgi:hypothetical protein